MRAIVAALGVISILLAIPQGNGQSGARPKARRIVKVPGDPKAGKSIFEGKGGCLQCHTVEGQGGVLGPDLSSMGVKRRPEQLRVSLLDPDEDIDTPYFTITVITSKGEEISGVRLNEDDASIQIRDAQNNLRSFVKSDLKELQRELRSLMPSYEGKLSAAELTDLIAYLASLRRPLPERPIDDDDDDI